MEQQTKKIILISIWSLAALVLVAGGILVWMFLAQFKTYSDSQFKFSIQYPGEWKLVNGYAGTVVTFLRPKDSALDVVQANGNVTVQEVPAHIATLKDFSATVTKQMTAVFGANINIVEDKDYTFGGMIGHKLFLAAPQPNNLRLLSVWVLKGPFAYIFTFLATEAQYKKLAPTIDYMIQSFKFSSNS